MKFTFISSFHYNKYCLIILTIKNIILILNLIPEFNSLSAEIKIASFPNFSNSKFNRKKRLDTKYIYGSSANLNYYYINLYIGEEKQKQGFILNTDDSITSSTCSLCKECGKHTYPYYKINSTNQIISCSDEKCKMVNSKYCNTNNLNNCSFEMFYSDGSKIKGIFMNEIISFGENIDKKKKIYIPIGCTTYENNIFYNKMINGIMGLGNSEKNFVELLYKSGAINNNIFSLCFAKLGGIFNIGEINNKMHLEKIIYFPMLHLQNEIYGINVESILINDIMVEKYRESKFIFSLNSGSSISYLGRGLFHKILNLILQQCPKDEGHYYCGKYEYDYKNGMCFYFKSEEELNIGINRYWPKIYFIIGEYTYKWDLIKNALIFSNRYNFVACIGIYKNYNSNNNSLGNNWFIDHDIIFDRKNKLIGIAEANCSQNENLNKTDGKELAFNDNSNNNYININKSDNTLKNVTIYNNSIDIKNNIESINDTLKHNNSFIKNKTLLENNTNNLDKSNLIINKNENKIKDEINKFKNYISNGVILFVLLFFIFMILLFIIIILKANKNKNIQLELKIEGNKIKKEINRTDSKISIDESSNNDSTDNLRRSQNQFLKAH